MKDCSGLEDRCTDFLGSFILDAVSQLKQDTSTMLMTIWEWKTTFVVHQSHSVGYCFRYRCPSCFSSGPFPCAESPFNIALIAVE
jgi:hypothetical protein